MKKLLFRFELFILLQCVALFFKSVLFVKLIQSLTNQTYLATWRDVLPQFPLHLPLYLALLSFAFLFRTKFIVALVINTCLSLLFLIDLIYYRAFGLPVSWFSLAGAGNLSKVGNIILGLIHPVDLFLFLDIVLWSLYIWWSPKPLTNRSWGKFVFFMMISLSFGYHEYYANGLMNQLIKYAHRPVIALKQVGPIGYHLADSIDFVKDSKSLTLTNQEKKQVRAWFQENAEKNQSLSASDTVWKGKFKNKNVIYIHFESLENSVINKKSNNREITPNLNQILRHSVYFSNIKEQVGEGNSADAEFMIFNSLYSLPQGIVSMRFPSNHFFSFPKQLKENGYHTAAFVGMEKGFMNMGVVLPNYGFEQIFSRSAFPGTKTVGLGVPDDKLYKQALPKMNKFKQPFFTYFITLTNHVPFYLPKSYQDVTLTNGINDKRIRDYLQTAHYADHALGQFLDKLKKSGLAKNTLLVIYGDHEGLNKYYWENVKASHIPWIKNNKTVPLILYNPSLKGQKIEKLGGQVDVLPTVSYLLDLPHDDRTVFRVGRNLFTSKENFAILHDGTYLLNQNTDIERKNFLLKGLEMSQEVIRANLFVNK